MEEEVGVKVTRLRRRLSVEAEDSKSPAAPSTPTKKRGGRLVAKPQLELIDENATEALPKRTRKSTIKDIIEPADEKPVTPSRRSTRIRSNTSILSETQSGETLDEKPMTPARRSVRIRSNTSLVSETTQNYDSPRAKRAARRTSQVGSDTEAPTTPARQTRRTRKDSIDKAEINAVKVGSPIKEVITEDVEINDKESNNNTSNSDSQSLRKSPRLTEKDPRKISTPHNDNKENEPQIDKDSSDKIEESDKPIQPVEISDSFTAMQVDSKPDAKMELKIADHKNISINSANLIQHMDTENKKYKSKMNKSTSIVEDSKDFKSKRQRTKSCTTISVPTPNDGSFYSDSEVSKKKKKRGSTNFDEGNNSGSGGGTLNLSSRTNKGKDGEKENTLNTSISSEKKKKRLSEKSITIDEPDQSVNAMLTTSNKSFNLKDSVAEIKNDTKEHVTSTIKNLSGAEQLFEEVPSGVVQTLVYIEDSDSNSGSVGKVNTEKPLDGGDQCVPVIEPLVDKSSEQPNNLSCEPMDIDETIPENASIILLTEKDTSMKPEGKRKSSICAPNEDVSINKTSNKSKRKSSIGNSESQNLDKTETENKSTLVLSQLKDISTNEEAVETNSIKNILDTHEPLSKSFNVNESDKNKNADKKNLSLNYSTSTPLQQKSFKKLGMQINTSIITPHNENRKEEVANKSKIKTAMLSQSDDIYSEKDVTDAEESEEENSRSKSLLIDEEAEEASDDYESGDSRDEEERQYEEDHEIKEKGETLNSVDEEEYSDDSDYEKGSFIVSSDEEDFNLLSGSEDDLDMSADELSMSAKSKKKYNERKIKEQKKASREMFQARHKLDESDKSTKLNKSKSKKVNRLDSSDSEDDDDDKVEKTKNRRQRIDSSQDVSVDVEQSLSKKKKKARRLSDSVCEDNAISENEMTICEENNGDKQDPLSVKNIVIKEELKTPQKAFDISTVQVTNIDEVEEIHVDENISMIKTNETSDPLQATALQYDDDSDIASISKNEEITQNYDSLLNNLNNTKSKQIKTLDMSLNINKKGKQKPKEPVIDQLNLTETKRSKKNKKTKTVDSPESINKSKNKIDAQNEDSSESIDMKLLFPEDSNDSGVLSAKKQNQTTEKDTNTNEIVEDFIPLKRTDAKTNMLDAIDCSVPDKSELNVSKKKNKKSKFSQPEYSILKEDQDDNDGSFFVDTTGSHIDVIESNILNKSSAKKNKNKRNSEPVTIFNESNNTSNTDKVELNMSLQNSGKKNKHNKKAASLNNTSEIKDDSVAKESDRPIDNYADLNISKNNSVLANTEEINDFANVIEVELATPGKNSAKKNKGKKKHASIIDAEETKDTEIAAMETSPVHSTKKNKKNKNSSSVFAEDIGEDVVDIDTSMNTSPMKNNYNDSLIVTELDISIKNSGKKNKKNRISLVDPVEIQQIDEVESNVSINNSKKNKSVSFITEENIDDAVNDGAVSRSEKKKKQNKKLLNTSKTNIETQEVDEIDGVIEKPINISLDTDGSHKKKKKRISESLIPEGTEDKHIILDEADKSQKRKRKLSANKNVEAKTDDAKDSDTSKSLNESITKGSQTKKRKVSHNNEDVAIQNEDTMPEIQEETTVKKSKKKNKHTQKADTHPSNENVLPSTEKDVIVNPINIEDKSQSDTRKVNKKRKRRDDDDEGKTSKIIKQNSFDKVHVPRLPADILKLLDDKPKQGVETTKANIISTTAFVVEEARKRRNKPSNYLEESVYLNDALVEKKRKATIKKPKVLPFIPTASTSDRGFTTNFRINVTQEQPVFAQSEDAVNFKNQYLTNKKIKKLGTFEKYKRQRNVKLSKF